MERSMRRTILSLSSSRDNERFDLLDVIFQDLSILSIGEILSNDLLVQHRIVFEKFHHLSDLQWVAHQLTFLQKRNA